MINYHETDPEFMERFEHFAFDEVINEPGQQLDDVTRHMAILATLLGCQGTDTTAKSEQQTRLGRALRGELAKDHCRNGNEALSHDNAGTELVDGCQGHERSAKSCQKSGQDHAGVTNFIHINSQRLTCFRMLAHCS